MTYNIKIDGVTKSTTSSYAWETDYSSAGTHTIDFTISDGIDQVTDQHIITVKGINDYRKPPHIIEFFDLFSDSCPADPFDPNNLKY